MCNMCGNLIIGLCWTKCSADCSITNEIFAHLYDDCPDDNGFNGRPGQQKLEIHAKLLDLRLPIIFSFFLSTLLPSHRIDTFQEGAQQRSEQDEKVLREDF